MPRQRKLRDADVLSALEAIRSGSLTQKQAANKLGITIQLMNAIVKGRVYRDLQGFTRGDRAGSGDNTRYGLEETPERRRHREARFWACVDMSRDSDRCWPHAKAKGNDYARHALFHDQLGTTMGHVVAYTLANGLSAAPTKGTVIRHLCDFKPCCNPAHLRLGTHAENQADRARAKREGNSVPRRVETPVLPPPGGWKITTGVLGDLELSARTAEFWANIDRRGPEECWPWIGNTRNQFGYGQFRWQGQQAALAHRIVYQLENGIRHYGDLPSDILHKCEKPQHRNECCNPRHLAAGTLAENRRDSIAHGTMPRGEKHFAAARFPDALIREMRESYWNKPPGERATYTDLAAKYGAAITSVSRWIRGESRLEAGGPTATPAAKG